jgi:hypothetical protein
MFWHRNAKKGIPAHRFMSLQLSADSWVRFILDFRAKYGVRVFLATIYAKGEGHAIYQALNRAKGTNYQNQGGF